MGTLVSNLHIHGFAQRGAAFFPVATAVRASHSYIMNDTVPIKNVRPVTMLFADAPASFSDVAQEAELPFIEEATEAGTRYVVDFDDLVDAQQGHPLIRQLSAISAEPANDSFWQICLEAR